MSVTHLNDHKRRPSLVRTGLRRLRPVGEAPIFALAGLGFLCVAAFTVTVGLGLAAIGASLLFLDVATGE